MDIVSTNLDKLYLHILFQFACSLVIEYSCSLASSLYVRCVQVQFQQGMQGEMPETVVRYDSW
jgi:hypothetical protein